MTYPPQGYPQPGMPPMPPPMPGAPAGFGGFGGQGSGTLLGNQPNPSADAFALQNGKMLKANLSQQSGMQEFYARTGAMVAYQGAVSFDGNYEGWGHHFRGLLAGEHLGLMKCHGSGTVYLANQAQDVHILDLSNANDGFTVDSQNVLAFTTGLNWDIVRIDTGGPGVAGAGAFNLEFTGRGRLVVTTTGAPLVMNVNPQNYYFADADAVIGWSTSLQVAMQAAVTTSSVWKPRGNTGESWQMQFSGEGFVVVQPCELLPPYNALAAGGLAERFGLGGAQQPGGAPGNFFGGQGGGFGGGGGGFGGLGGLLGGR
ncbi:AIM24 family protein [Fodinicola acaciae]|uniref:AIM24 family protein n=1 Tax=Fodinicola acaciae TaxID=2681555 RepID=UPI0013D34B36|nr:AIM24 family protein [Fodinicola acaciae]